MGVDQAVAQLPSTLKLDLSGNLHKLSIDKLQRFPDSLLYKLSQTDPERATDLGLCADYNPITQEYFFDRPVHIFPIIMSAYLTGAVHITSAVCAEELREELKFWNLPTSALNPCCIGNLSDIEKPLWIAKRSASICPFEGHSHSFYSKLKRSIWYILEKPTSCKVALMFMLVSLMFVIASMCILVMGTIPEFQTISKSMNVTKPMYALLLADDVCLAWFTLEYLVRLLTAPSILAYVTNWTAVVDLLSFLPTYVEIALSVHNSNFNHNDVERYMFTMRMVGLLRVFRCLRLVKLVRYSPGLLAIFRTLRKSFKELLLMVLFTLTVDLVMATLIYFLESEVEDTQFNTIPAAAWWGIVTITTVGYGEMVPSTIGGKLVASATVLLGILIIALPVSIITQNFGIAYAEVREEFGDEMFSLRLFLQSPWLPQFPETTNTQQPTAEGETNKSFDFSSIATTTNDNDRTHL